MPENLLKKVFAGWFEYSGYESEYKIEQATRANSETSLPGGLGSFIFDFWQRRPTRLFNLLEDYNQEAPQRFFSFLDHEIKRVPTAFASSFYSQTNRQRLHELALKHQELELAEIIKNLLNDQRLPSDKDPVSHQPAVPLIIAGNKGLYPQVIFDSFSNDFTLLMNMPADSQVIWQHRLICEMFMKQFREAVSTMPVLPMMCFPFPGFNAEGGSFAMGLWVTLWLASHNRPETCRICCTGTIDTSNGQFGEVSFLDQKIEAALATGFDICLVPAACKDAKKFRGNKHIIPLHDVSELNNWLTMNTGNTRQIHRVVNWLQSDRQIPEPEDFTAFFAKPSFGPIEIVTGWKSLIRHLTPTAGLRKIIAMIRAYCSNYVSDTNKLLAFLPTSFRYTALPWLLSASDCSTAMAEQLYSDFSRRCAESSPEIYIASRLLLEKSHFSILARPDFFTLRQRYPLLLWLFFREPAEMLAAFSLLDERSGLENHALDSLLKLLEKHVRSYVSISGNRRTDAAIMQKILKKYDPDAHFRAGPVLTIRKRLFYLWNAMHNFARLGHKRAVSCCHRLLRLHLRYIADKTGADISTLLPIISENASANSNNLPMHLQKMPALHDLLQALRCSNQKTGQSHDQYSSHNLFKKYKSALTGKSPDMLWFPQPGLAFLRAILTDNWCSLNFFSILRKFGSDNYQSPSAELRQACLAYWAGLICAHYYPEESKLTKSRFYRQAGGLLLPFLAGWLTQQLSLKKYAGDKICETCRTVLQTKDFPADTLFWSALLPAECQKCIKPWLTRQLSREDSNLSATPLRQKKKVFIEMMYNLTGAAKDSAAADFWQQSLKDCARQGHSARRTVQALAPIYYLLSGNRRQALRHLRQHRHLVNNSEFTLAFLLRFSRFGRQDYRLRPVSEISLSFEQQLFNSLTLGYYRLYRKGLFNSYLIDKIEDLPNFHLISILTAHTPSRHSREGGNPPQHRKENENEMLT